jgi:hypothetical protein
MADSPGVFCKRGSRLPILLTRLLTTVLDGGGCQRNHRTADQAVRTCPDHQGQP